MQTNSRSPLLLMSLTILIDFTGFGLIIPLLPFWAEHLHANAIGVGLILTTYALAQFIFTPLLGKLSDRYGRKPIIVVSLLIETISLALTALSGTLIALFIARFIGGIGASNIGSAQAVVSDVTEAKDRAKGMGMIGASIGLGFVIGPLLGGILSPLGTTMPFWIAGGLALLNTLFVALFLPETGNHLAITSVAPAERGIKILFTSWRKVVRSQAILSLILVNLLFTLAFTSMETVFPLFSQKVFGWGASQNGYIFTYVGFLVVIMQGGLVGQLVKRWHEQRVLLLGLLLLAVGLVVLAFSYQLSLLLISLALISIGDGAITPTVSTLLSFSTTSENQGETLGLSQGVAGLGRSVGPLAAGLAYLFSPAAPFIAGGILVVLALLLAVPTLSHIQRPAALNEQTVTRTVEIENSSNAEQHI